MANNKRLIAKINFPDGNIIIVDNNLLSVEFGALDRGSLTDVIDWGIYANRGSLSFIDNIGYFNNANINSSQIKNAKVQIYLKKNEEKLLATFDVADTNFDDATRRVDIELQSHLLTWQKIKTSTIYDNTNVNSYTRTAFFFISLIMSAYGITLNIDTDTIKYLKKIYFFCPFFEADTLWNILTQICQATMCRVSENESGEAILSCSHLTKTPIIADTFNVINFSNFDFLKVTNPEIDVIDREWKKDIRLDNLTKEIELYDSSGVRVTEDRNDVTVEFEGNEGVVGTVYATINAKFNSQYKFKKADIALSGYTITFQGENTFVAGYVSLVNDIVTKNVSISDDFSSVILALKIKASVTSKSGNVVSGYTNTKVKAYPVSANYFNDIGTNTYSELSDDTQEATRLASNNLIQLQNIYDDFGDRIPLYSQILDQIRVRYSNGIECLECECLMNNYANENGAVVLNGNNLEHFEKYDIVIPYTIKRGVRQPLRTKADGTPKQFRVIGISYSYAGHLTQKLHLQEER